jgi:hypothetical protein
MSGLCVDAIGGLGDGFDAMVLAAFAEGFIRAANAVSHLGVAA